MSKRKHSHKHRKQRTRERSVSPDARKRLKTSPNGKDRKPIESEAEKLNTQTVVSMGSTYEAPISICSENESKAPIYISSETESNSPTYISSETESDAVEVVEVDESQEALDKFVQRQQDYATILQRARDNVLHNVVADAHEAPKESSKRKKKNRHKKRSKKRSKKNRHTDENVTQLSEFAISFYEAGTEVDEIVEEEATRMSKIIEEEATEKEATEEKSSRGQQEPAVKQLVRKANRSKKSAPVRQSASTTPSIPMKNLLGLSISPESQEHRIWSKNREHSPLLRLPVEIRNRIYKELFDIGNIFIGFITYVNTPIEGTLYKSSVPVFKYIRKTTRSYENPFDDTTPTRGNLTFLNGVCRQLYAETAILPYKYNRWAFDRYHTLFNFIFMEKKFSRAQLKVLTRIMVPDRLPYPNILKYMGAVRRGWVWNEDERSCYKAVKTGGVYEWRYDEESSM